MTSENLNIVLTNSLCCISAQAAKVSKLYSIGDKCAESELQKLKLMNDWFEALRCYNANDSIHAKFVLHLDYDVYSVTLKNPSDVNKKYIITVNNIIYSVNGDGVTNEIDLVTNLILSIDGINTLNLIIDPDTKNPRLVSIYIDANCNIQSINYKVIQISDNTILTDIDWTLYQTGQCTILNCLTKDQFNIMVANLMKVCNICECQLNQ